MCCVCKLAINVVPDRVKSWCLISVAVRATLLHGRCCSL